MYSKTQSASLEGIDARIIEIEVESGGGMPSFNIVGLVGKSISESKDRVNTALISTGFPPEAGKILVNLMPAHLRKEGSHFDLGIAAALMVNCGYIDAAPQLLESFAFFGELSLNGKVKEVIGLLPLALEAQQQRIRYIVVPQANYKEASLINLASQFNAEVYAVRDLFELRALLEAISAGKESEQYRVKVLSKIESKAQGNKDLSDVIGQEHAKRGLEIAAAGRHHLLMIGPPGCGKSMLASRFINLLPELSFDEALELTKIYSITGLSDGELMLEPPLRMPHHSASNAALVGGGSRIKPGEASLAHHGVLFLDELTEFNRHSIEQFRQILEDKNININRIRQTVNFPADFILIAACNPCPCGYLGDKLKACSCAPQQIARYLGKLSGPLLDRSDMHIELSRLSYEEIQLLNRAKVAEPITEAIRSKVVEARSFAKEINQAIKLNEEELKFMDNAVMKLELSARSHQKILRLARTIANLDYSEQVKVEHLAEALSFRAVDWEVYAK